MTDIFLYQGEANPNDVKLLDPTTGSLPTIDCSASLSQGEQSLTATTQLTCDAAISLSQGSQTLSAAMLLASDASISLAQGGQSLTSAMQLVSDAAISLSQGGQSLLMTVIFLEPIDAMISLAQSGGGVSATVEASNYGGAHQTAADVQASLDPANTANTLKILQQRYVEANSDEFYVLGINKGKGKGRWMRLPAALSASQQAAQIIAELEDA